MNALTATLPALGLQFAQFASSWLDLPGDVLAGPRHVPAQPTHVLHPQETLWLDTAAGLQVACVDGCVLLQYQGRPRGDVILVRGESHACEGGARVAVQAFVPATLRIGAAAAS